jgi:hypothetical protein
MSLKPRKNGRPSNVELLAIRASAAEVLQGVNQERMWKRFLDSEDEKVALDCWKYLNDRVHGKPKQSVESTGPDGGPIETIVKQVIVNV